METYIMTPLALSMLAHFSCAATPYPNHNLAPQQEIIAEFITSKIIRPTRDPDNFIYKLTGKGTAFFTMVSRTPYPEHKWIDPRESTDK